MKGRHVLLMALGVVPLALAVSLAVAAQGRDGLRAPNGVMMNVYQQGVPANGAPFPDGIHHRQDRMDQEEERRVALQRAGSRHAEVCLVH